MDEPTASLSADEAGRLFRIIRELAASGVALLYVSHRLDEITSLCDRVTVFKDGRSVASVERATMSKADLIRAIVGGEAVAAADAPAARADRAEWILEVQHLRRLPAVRDLSFEVHAGEVLGLAGLVGAGRTEVARILFGADRLESGAMTLDGEPYRPRGTHDAVHAGIFLVPEERRSQGLILRESLAFNVDLPSWGLMQVSPGVPLINKREGARRATEVVKALRIKADSVRTPVSQLSGGNQQKVVLGGSGAGRGRCSWTSRPAASTSAPAPRSTGSSASSPGRASASSSSPRSSGSWSTAIASWSWSRAGRE